QTMMQDLDAVFALHWIVLLPPAIVVWSIMRRTPPALAITLSSVAAVLIGIVVQGFGVQDAIAAAVGGFRVGMIDRADIAADTLSPAFATLVERGGLYSMATTLVVIIAAFLLAAAMDVSGALDLLIRRMLDAVRS